MKKAIILIFILIGFMDVPHASGYTISSLVGQGCHELLASKALRAVRLNLSTAKPLSTTDDERALADDVEFSPDADMKDVGGITFLLSVRDNDLKGQGINDLSQLALVHGDPKFQDEHCLRNEKQDEPGGSAAAVLACRTFIQKRISEALDGLDASGNPDVTKRTTLPIHLSLRGDIDAPLPTYYVRMGQAIHAIQDSFTHTYRTPDGTQITVVLNWIDLVNGNLDESRDGPGHAKALDVCDDPDSLRKKRKDLATAASIDLLQATLDPQLTKTQKMTAVNGVLDTYLTYSPGCNFENNWCNARERQYKDQTGAFPGCSSDGGGLLLGIIVFMILQVLAIRRNKSTYLVMISSLIFVCAAFTATDTALAEPAKEENSTSPPPNVVPVVEPGPQNKSQAAWGLYTGLSGSIHKPAFAGTVGIRRRTSKHWTFGWDAEMNPWIALNGAAPVRIGVFNTYGTVIYRIPLAYQDFNLRTTLNIGSSTLLMNLYGAPRWTTGLYGGISPLGIEWKANKNFYLILNPLNFAIPIPQLEGVPLTYAQYRFTIGLEWLSR